MEFRYPHLSSGYVDHPHGEKTLNSKFYGDFSFNCIDEYFKLDEDIILFPQRIPKTDFFKELYKLETFYYKEKFNNNIDYLLKYLTSISHVSNLKPNEKIIRLYLNWANLCVRHALFQEVVDLTPMRVAHQPFEVEIQIIKESAKIDLQLSKGLPVNVDGYIELAELYIPRYASDREEILLLNQLIVTYYRHQKIKNKNKTIYKYAKNFLSLLEKQDINSIHNQLYCSIGYRGLAMVEEFGLDMQSDFIKRSESLAINAKAPYEHDESTILENQNVCFQSMAKWHLRNNDIKHAEMYFNKMIQIDPLDSTGYSELGFFYLRLDRQEDASKHFKKAMELGPPGTGMNAYYYAKCLETLGKENDAINYLYEAAELDPQGISPWLDLLDHYHFNKKTDSAIKIASHIYLTPILYDQLNENEIHHIQRILN